MWPPLALSIGAATTGTIWSSRTRASGRTSTLRLRSRFFAGGSLDETLQACPADGVLICALVTRPTFEFVTYLSRLPPWCDFPRGIFLANPLRLNSGRGRALVSNACGRLLRKGRSTSSTMGRQTPRSRTPAAKGVFSGIPPESVCT